MLAVALWSRVEVRVDIRDLLGTSPLLVPIYSFSRP